MKYLKIFPAVAVLLCISITLQQYKAPSFEVKQPEEIKLLTETAKADTEKKEKEEKKKQSQSVKKEKNAKISKTVSLPETSGGVTQAAAGGSSAVIQKVEEPAAYLDGTYEGSGNGFRGTVRVQVVVQGGKVTSITVLESSDDHPFFDNASALIGQIIQKQTTNVDAVSGATYSSRGILEAVRNALKQAANPAAGQQPGSNTDPVMVEPSSGITSTPTEKQPEERPSQKPTDAKKQGAFPYKDGVYSGTGKGYHGDVTVAITIKKEEIRSIEVKDSEDDPSFFERAKALLDQIVKKQTVEVDVVSGATYSSKGLLEAVKNAIAQAKKATKKPGKPSTGPSAKPTSKPSKAPSTQPKPSKAPSTPPKPSESPSTSQIPSQDEKQQYLDGTYVVEATCDPDEEEDFQSYRIQAKVTIQKDRIVAITDIKGIGSDYDSNNDWYLQRAANGSKSATGVVQQITGQGKAEKVDAVSGATCSSKAIIAAVRKALERAKS